MHEYKNGHPEEFLKAFALGAAVGAILLIVKHIIGI